jgi:hypothetical protein
VTVACTIANDNSNCVELSISKFKLSNTKFIIKKCDVLILTNPPLYEDHKDQPSNCDDYRDHKDQSQQPSCNNCST